MAFVTYVSGEVADSAPLHPGCALTPRLVEPEHSRRLQTPRGLVIDRLGLYAEAFVPRRTGLLGGALSGTDCTRPVT